MFENILNELKNELSGSLTKIPGLSSNQLDDVLKVAGEEVTKHVGQQMMSGNISTLMNLFSHKPNSSSANVLQESLFKGITNGLISKLGLNESIATQIVNMILPAIIEKVTHINSQTPDDDDSPLRQLFGGGGGAASAIGGLLNKLF